MNRVIVTGGAGFIGANYLHTLFADPSFTGKILNIDKLTYAGNLESLQDLEAKYGNSRYFFEQADICDAPKMKEIMHQFQPDTIVHFAAESHVDRSIDGPMEFVQTNLVGTATLLNSALEYYRTLDEEAKKRFRFHNVSTDEVFGSLGENGMFTEETPYDPSSPYSASKAGSDHLVRAWQRTFGLPITISNCSNNYGPYQFPEKLIPLMILNCLAHQPLPVYGKGINVRDWLFVTDHCEAINIIIRKGKVGETYNIGGHNEMKNIDIVTTICKILDEMEPSKKLKSYTELITFVQDRPGHDLRYAIDATKIEKELGWKPAETFATGIRKTVAWYLENKQWWQNIQNNKYRQERLGIG
ncbi:MAG: dTDP-glucose 4,6-dehydratase [Candidatus Cloacimonas acidaminovorans]|jgi:dTDP-glucose 4,6-dehydratase|uniref:dTDP-glucose 4,6-dehydratase n=1 Tax=Cloacimonas acidaminovorans (strain Evry) TaxID=459349 RepID=B0VFD4_CLOAI|nr:dTDP-glucose 4,6-dehydratase [Candidatus Cloacimonas acidaminovorans]MDD3606144.1 dTDP-glucose 4,6-dehydratase [Candidatus Cloacimonas acidaminovorans]MDD5407206.1 dTDP-glucose 4,6-dehydratase [Candidatus Cloacimonas acidaminovorans]MDY0219101.1 dTDP-glucose 4,6-dehydratase [Candidatus Cloacimonas acidaminovorans]CAO80186.1 dTDP-glucose 4,6-dehydratase [Candidatus Cloacimonas acidaminovorans str. Evry]HOE55847.1 dTDP-glucose 4,6-dehydratase [Candidatus Cloacimonas acidaminovorans]